MSFASQVLVGMVFAVWVFGVSARLKSEDGFGMIFRLGVFPLFLFSGAFFPVSNLGAVGETVARLTPLWQGVNLSRMFAARQRHLVAGRGQRDRARRAPGRRLVLGGLRAAETAGVMTADRHRAAAPVSPAQLVRRAAAARLPQLHRLQGRVEAVPHRLPRAGLLPVLDRHRRRRADHYVRGQRPGDPVRRVRRARHARGLRDERRAARQHLQHVLQAQVHQALRPDAGHAADHPRRRARRDRVGPAARRQLLGDVPGRDDRDGADPLLVGGARAAGRAADRVRDQRRCAWR